ncbi:5' nucleotidase, NT5C type [Clostridium sp. 'White wine YQ']|uniref:5' nucleotidase, NT5C type n=1 Tax=Clostridium sp. 'White wine YQ' TaxID=3027474 RepID=UPI002365402D|nr:hypothetical protein [Clostridium sp. 'White wine YQ']MDD7794226.1 hypothetical protein [Clostridium sp. 'White wine YQ']
MNNLNICIDIDGTITDAYYWLDLCNYYFNTNITKEQVTEYAIHNVLGVNEEAYNEFYEKNKFILHEDQPLRENVQEIITKLAEDNSIYFVTARDTSLSMLTHRYLRNNNIPYNDLFVLGSHYKVDKAIDLNCDIFIEDNYENAIQLSTAGFKVLLLDTNYNRHILNENIIRVHYWNEIYEIIEKLLLQNKAM